MEEQEAPLEDVHEQIHEHAEHSRERWVMGVAVSTAIIAAIAAISSLLSGDNVNEAMLEQIKASDTWSYYQAEGIKSSQLETRVELLQQEGKSVGKEQEKLKHYEERRADAKKDATELEGSSKKHMERHHKIAKSVTWSQIAIAVSAIAVLTRQRWFWLVGLGFGVAGLFYLLVGALA